MTNMDKKINELNAKLGKKTGVDFKGSAKVMGKEFYANKPVYFGTLGAIGALVFTSAGFILSALIGTGIGYGVKKYNEKKDTPVSEVK